MLMYVLRDSMNWIWDYEGNPDDMGDTGGGTTLQEMEDWFAETGWYQTPEFKPSLSPSPLSLTLRLLLLTPPPSLTPSSAHTPSCSVRPLNGSTTRRTVTTSWPCWGP